MRRIIELLRRWFDPHLGARQSILARWIFLRALALIYFSAFYSLLFQIKGLIGPQGILPASNYLLAVTRSISARARCGTRPLCSGFRPTRRP